MTNAEPPIFQSGTFRATTTQPLLIALNSPAPGMGKSTVANRLVERHGFRLLKFAAPLKDMVRVLLKHCGIDESRVERYVDGDLKELVIPELGITSRHLQITLGTEWGRDLIRDDLWVRTTRQSVERCHALGLDVVIDDLRFDNEYEMVRRLGGHAVRVFRPGVPQPPEHRSEGALKHHAMHNIHNLGTIDQLHLDVDALVEQLRAS